MLVDIDSCVVNANLWIDEFFDFLVALVLHRWPLETLREVR